MIATMIIPIKRFIGRIKQSLEVIVSNAETNKFSGRSLEMSYDLKRNQIRRFYFQIII